MRRRLMTGRRWRALALLALFTWCGHAEVIDRDGIRIEFPPEARQLAEESLVTLEVARESYTDRLPKSPTQLNVVICGSNVEFKKYARTLTTYSILGIAQPEKDLIVLKAPSLTPPGSDYRGTLRHELIHILLRHNVNTDNLPRWLNEGIAMVISGENRWESKSVVASMYLNGRILTYRELELSFLDPGNELEFGDAYAQAYSMTLYLMDELGDDRFWDLIGSLDSRTFGSALEAELGKIPYDFWADWKSSLGWTAIVFSIVSGFSLFQIMAVLTLLAYWRKRRRGLQVIQQWDDEDAERLPDGDEDDAEEWSDEEQD